MKKFIAVILGLISALTMLTACGPSSRGLDYDFSETDETVDYKLFSAGFQQYEGLENDRVLKFLENKFNVKLEIIGASDSAWENRLSTEIFDGNTPDLFFSLPHTSAYTDYIRKEVITDLNPYIERAGAENLKAMLGAEQFKKSVLIDGKNYFIPKVTGVSNHTLYVRKDWMNLWNEARGAEKNAVPATLSEFTSMLQYFADENLSGGRKTYGLSLCKNIDYYKDFMGTFGVVPDYYKDENGKHQISALTDEYKEMMDWFKAGCRQGYVYPDFYILTEDENRMNFLQGTCGAMISNGDSIIDGVLTKMRELYPDDFMDRVELIAMPDSDDGSHKGGVKGWDWYWGGWSVSADAKEPMRLIRILDYLFSEEGQKLLIYGVKDVHYTETDGQIVPNFAERLKDGVQTFLYPDSSKGKEPYGRYNIGYILIPVPFTVSDGRLVRNFPSDAYFSSEFIEKSYDIVDNTPEKPANYSAVRILVSDSELSISNAKIMDAVQTFTFNYISGKNYDAELSSLNGSLKNNNADKLLEWYNVNNI